MRLLRLLCLLLIAGAATLGLAATGNAVPPPPDVRVVLEPGRTSAVGPSTTAGVERVAGQPGQADSWLMNASIQIRNDSAGGVQITGAQLTIGSITTAAIAANQLIAAGTSARFYFDKSIAGVYPLPSATLRVSFQGFDDLVKTYTLVDFASRVPGGYILPFHDGDLGSNVLWAVAQGHGANSGHFSSHTQAYAYDIDAVRYDAATQTWTNQRSTAAQYSAKDPRRYVVFNDPMYAMASGTVIECRFHLADRQLGDPDTNHGAGNSIWIRTAPGEIISYAHLKQNSIPADLCPQESVNAYDSPSGVPSHALPKHVQVGQMIGRIGYTGTSDFPHTHIQLSANAPYDIDDLPSQTAPSMPFTFRRYQVGGTFATKTATPPMATVTDSESKALPEHIWFRPNAPCPFNKVDQDKQEAYLLDDNSSCLNDHVSDLSHQGFGAVQIDGGRIGSRTLYDVIGRRNEPDTITAAGLTKDTFTSKNASVPEGYGLVDLDAYSVGTQVRISAVWKAGYTYSDVVPVVTVTGDVFDFRDHELRLQGYYPRLVSAVGTANGTLYSALYEPGPSAGIIIDNKPAATYQSTRDAHIRNHLVAISIEGYNQSSPAGTPRVIAVWAPDGIADFRLEPQLTATAWANAWSTEVQNDFLTTSLSTYQSLGLANFAALWQDHHVY